MEIRTKFREIKKGEYAWVLPDFSRGNWALTQYGGLKALNLH